ncbi:decaprenyl-phosphate phosphoribosyltransferase [Marinicella gelatinilytica]|uniref:decaprenyl-phosphate phosphoribosyltransferase n=1 Tax=Marinicella gelatinilytica TaxID=2996017 RepID=UPI002260930A|nr:decaprenyl-phosphate phosphoribosyltransferase [Marinicella gelatinilytica]MCX7544467.1 decaprenyl-phosphate phosphoribosyltransferase [Marinicella gelatinilytica]
MQSLKNLITLLRPHQYLKNLFVFAPLFFAFAFEASIIWHTLAAFILFCLIASAIYVFNDLNDVAEDRTHPTKKYRPIASDAVSKQTAVFLFLTLSLVALVVAYFFQPALFYVLLIYFLINIAYSLGLKHVPIIDIFMIAIGFVLRLFAGNVFLDQPLSMWIIIMTFLLAIFLGIAKRRDDVLLQQQGHSTRKNIDGYNLEFINATMVLMSAVIIIGYIQYTISPEVMKRFGTDYVYLTGIFVILGILRYMQITFVEQKSSSPTRVLIHDLFIQLTIVAWLVSYLLIYFFAAQ